ncbi:hypothetical protein [Alteromonas sp. ASW11-130]|uniref:hypothetical protein n=1 Tax=Alteromonas sp. ASW11-130 TaxID=3015775 RepID=UPI0022423337|nr:hypothetical protein [Alteromonas sp. ASW11-130]MCW8090586.1 hypothetical protein [Alteromonas sp. ASW11-130]
MKKFKTLINVMLLASCSLFAASKAQAAIILQDMFVSGYNIGSVLVEVDNDFMNTGYLDTDFDFPAIQVLDMSVLGLSVDVFDIFAEVNTDTIFGGLTALVFDVSDTDAGDPWAYQFVYDTALPDDNFADIFDSAGGLLLFAEGGEVQLGEAFLFDVPLPSSLSLAGLMALVLFSRRRVQK